MNANDTSAIESEIAADLRLINNLSKIKDYRDAEIRYLRQKLNALHQRYTYLGNILEENGIPDKCRMVARSNEFYKEATKPEASKPVAEPKTKIKTHWKQCDVRPSHRQRLGTKSRSKLISPRKMKRKYRRKKPILKRVKNELERKPRGRPRKVQTSVPVKQEEPETTPPDEKPSILGNETSEISLQNTLETGKEIVETEMETENNFTNISEQGETLRTAEDESEISKEPRKLRGRPKATPKLLI